MNYYVRQYQELYLLRQHYLSPHPVGLTSRQTMCWKLDRGGADRPFYSARSSRQALLVFGIAVASSDVLQSRQNGGQAIASRQ